MSTAARTAARAAGQDMAEAGRQAVLRFSVGVTAAFVACEAMQWTPSFLAPVLTAVLLASLPMRPPLKMGLALWIAMAAAALLSFVLASWLRGMPVVLLGLIGLCMFLAFDAMAAGRPRLPALLLLICLATIPVVVMIAPAQAGLLPLALIRAITLALLVIGLAYTAWPRASAPAPAATAAPAATPWRLALLCTAVVLPLMLVYLLFGLADALPVIVATVMLVVNFEPRRSRLHALAMIAGNFAGGLLGLLMHAVLLTAPGLPFLAGLLLLVLLGFGQRIVAGGPLAGVALIACNAMLIIFGSALASGTGTLAIWLLRLFQFALAGAFAVAMMSLLWPRAAGGRSAPANPQAVARDRPPPCSTPGDTR